MLSAYFVHTDNRKDFLIVAVAVAVAVVVVVVVEVVVVVVVWKRCWFVFQVVLTLKYGFIELGLAIKLKLCKSGKFQAKCGSKSEVKLVAMGVDT